MRPRMTCADVRPLLFELLEGELSREEHEAVGAHLLACPACRGELVAEQALTGLLGRPDPRPGRRPIRSLVACTAAAILVIVAVVMSLGRDEDAHGAVRPSHLGLDLAPVEGEDRPLGSANHFRVPTGESRRIRLAGTATVQAEGPALFEVDRGDPGWKIVLLRGRLAVRVDEGGFPVVAVTLDGLHDLEPGTHEVLAEAPPAKPPAPGPTPATLVEDGRKAFFSEEDFPKAEALFRRAHQHPDATKEERSRAGFYLHASLGRQGKREEAVRVGEAWVKNNPEDPSRHYVLLFVGVYHAELGHAEAARNAWQTIVREAPESDLAEHARRHLGGGATAAAARPQGVGYTPGRVLPMEPEGGGGYLVVRTALKEGRREHAGFAMVAADAARFHEAEVIDFDGEDVEGLARALSRRRPESVLFVVPPDVLDTGLHRRILLLSTKIDDDVFPDFAFGWLTARDGAAARKLWARTRTLHEKGLGAKTWIQTAVTSGPRSLEHGGSVPPLALAAGFEGTSLYYAFPSKDAGAWEFVDKALRRLEGAGVITMTGNGDPEGIWLFDDHRNVDREKHWAYDADKVGHDPEGEMPRITAGRFRALKLARPIVWSGTCHSGAACRVFVEGDIVSTFGRTDRVTLHRLPPDRSLCLALLDAGAAAFLCPLGANHGMSVSREVEFALSNGATLGETIKSTWDDVCLAALDDLHLDLPEPGEAHRSTEPVMQGGGANRALIGDPALRPFEATAHPLETVEIANRHAKGFDVVVTWKPGWHPMSWDMFGLDRARGDRIFARVAIDDLVPHDRPVKVSATLKATGTDGKALPYVLTRAEPEVFHGRRFLHLQANIARARGREAPEVRAVFAVTVE